MLLADDGRDADKERDLLVACCFVLADAAAAGDEEEDLVSLCDALRVSYKRDSVSTCYKQPQEEQREQAHLRLPLDLSSFLLDWLSFF